VRVEILIVGQEDHTTFGKDRLSMDFHRNSGNISELAKKVIEPFPERGS